MISYEGFDFKNPDYSAVFKRRLEFYNNLKAHPEDVSIQDGPEPFPVSVRELSGDERKLWWDRAVAAYPPYAEYQEKTERVIPVFLASPRTGR
mgnify:CR=1 FL=1